MQYVSRAICCASLIALLIVHQADGLKCYTCTSLTGGCNDEFKPGSQGVTIVDCMSGSCQKSKINDLVTRSCMPGNFGDTCKEEGDVHLCFCDKDLCNAAPMVAAVPGLLMAALTLLYRLL